MTKYLDSSALVPLLLVERGTGRCEEILSQPDRAVSSILSLAETAAAIARAERMRRITAGEHEAARHELQELWERITPVPATESVVRFAGDLARRYGLRGYDAVQCASALAAADEPDFFVVSGDRTLLAAWNDLGLCTVDVSAD